MASKIETLTREIERLKEMNQSLIKSCQNMETEISEMREQQNAGCGINQTEYLQLKQENEMLKSENYILKQRLKRLEEKHRNSRGAGRKNKLSPSQIEEIQNHSGSKAYLIELWQLSMAVQSEQFATCVQKSNNEQLGSGISLPISLAVPIHSLIAALALS